MTTKRRAVERNAVPPAGAVPPTPATLTPPARACVRYFNTMENLLYSPKNVETLKYLFQTPMSDCKKECDFFLKRNQFIQVVSHQIYRESSIITVSIRTDFQLVSN